MSLPRPGRVLLTAHDLQGRRLEVIANRDYDAGYHTIRWRGPRNGVCFVRLLVDGVSVGVRRIVVPP